MAKKPKTVQTPYEQNNEVIETPDIAAFRAYSPDLAMLQPAVDAQFEDARRQITDSYGAYSGIPSHVARNRLRDESLADLEGERAMALATGDENNKRIKMAQLEALANMTKKTKSYGFGTQAQQSQGGIGSALISGGAGIASAAILA